MWLLKSRKPLAFGGWQYVVQGPDGTFDKVLTWFPGDNYLMWDCRPFRGGGFIPDGATARAADKALLQALAGLNRQDPKS